MVFSLLTKVHSPWWEQSLMHCTFSLQSSPLNPAWQVHLNAGVPEQAPLPEQSRGHRFVAQSSPDHSASHTQDPLTHFPLSLQPFGHGDFSHSHPVQPFLHAHSAPPAGFK
jgi:hypothetical protein